MIPFFIFSLGLILGVQAQTNGWCSTLRAFDLSAFCTSGFTVDNHAMCSTWLKQTQAQYAIYKTQCSNNRCCAFPGNKFVITGDPIGSVRRQCCKSAYTFCE